MSDKTYVAEFVDGPLEGQSDTRSLTGDGPDEIVPMMAAVEGLESIFRYRLAEVRDVEGTPYGTYRFDEGDSDPVAADDDGAEQAPITGIY